MPRSSVKGYFRQLTNADDDYRRMVLSAIHQYGTPKEYTRAILMCSSIDKKREEKRIKQEEREKRKIEKENEKQRQRREKKEEQQRSVTNMQKIEENMDLHIKHLIDPSLVNHHDNLGVGNACPICGVSINEFKHVINIDKEQLKDSKEN